ncbi:DgyrCDS1068 [Dimorphilus gyrociliatus]|uniref:DgyrCDS1068 n=1 Tax=Dimorphilus gyrociliatus TaxID=2664684 RepID=A0A7I8V6D2_9ANNE|nr:DgyrCDS1068 [Dimorphilus gyrociliatus]
MNPLRRVQVTGIAPKFAVLAYSGIVNERLEWFMSTFFTERIKNPNGCTASATIFVTENEQSCIVQRLFIHGHEIGIGLNPKYSNNWWYRATEEQWTKETGWIRDTLSKQTSIPVQSIRGVRSSRVTPGGNNHYKALEKTGFLYDSSIKTENILWPITLDFPWEKYSRKCISGICPNETFPGLWEVPLIPFTQGGQYVLDDLLFTEKTSKQITKFLIKEIEMKLKEDEPIFLNFGETILHSAALRDSIRDILKYLSKKKIWIVPMSSLIEWTKRPVIEKDIFSKGEFQCVSRVLVKDCKKRVNIFFFGEDNQRLLSELL